MPAHICSYLQESDGNFVLYGCGNKAVWASNTPGHAPGQALLSGNQFELIDAAGACWAT